MKKLITLLAVLGMVLALGFSGVAEAAVTPTGGYANTGWWVPDTHYTADFPTAGDWTMIGNPAGDVGRGTLTIAAGSLFDTDGYAFPGMSWGAANPATMTVTGSGSRFLGTSVSMGTSGGTGTVIVAAGGLVDVPNGLTIGNTGQGLVDVAGADSALTSTNGTITIGQQTGGSGSTLTIADSGLVQTKTLKFGVDSGTSGYAHMAVGGVLAVWGNKATIDDMFSTGGNGGEIQYNPSGDEVTWVNMTGAAIEDTDYTLVYHSSTYIVNGQELNGYTVLTMLVPPPAGTVITLY